jgi:FixJ family two-component response regulator
MTSRSTIFIVDDDDAVVRSLRWLIATVGQQVETFSSARAFLDGYDHHKPGCLVLDLRMPDMSGLDLQEHLRVHGIQIPTIFITGHGDVQVALRAMRAGAFDFVEKPFNDQDLLDRIQKAIHFDLEQRGKSAQRAQLHALFASLTTREQEVLNLVVEGLPNKSIARELGLSAKTVEVYRGSMMGKMQARSVADLVKLAMQHKRDNELLN